MGNISEQSVFGNYEQKENQVTSALLKILKEDEHEILLNALLQDIGGISLPEKSLRIETQAKSKVGHSVPDGKLSCRYAFDIYIESKLGTTINEKQLENHLELLNTNKNVILIYITQHQTRPNDILPEDVLWANWTQIYHIINRVHEEGVSPVLDYLIDQFYLLLSSLKLYDNSDNRVIIVGGRWGEPIALEYGFYACQGGRSFKKAKYLAFYHSQRIQYLFEIEYKKEDVDIQTLKGTIPKEYFLKKEPLYKPEERTFFKLKKIKDFSPTIKNDNMSKNGRCVAFTQGQTYTTLDKIMKAQVTSELR